MKQRPLLKGDGPIGLILVPTRELAMQIYSEAKKFGKVYNLSVVCAYGGGSKWEQSKAFEAGAEIAVSVDAELDTVLNCAMHRFTILNYVRHLILDSNTWSND